jgi:hypothetical protein
MEQLMAFVLDPGDRDSAAQTFTRLKTELAK